MEPQVFALGWSPESAARAAARTGYVATGFRADGPIPPAYSLTQYRRRKLVQGPVGTCWVHSSTRLAETVLVAEGQFEYAEICRALIGYRGKQIEGGGNPDDGGNASDSLAAMLPEDRGGLGTCHESAWPYHDDWGRWQLRSYLGQRPPAAATADIGFYLGSVAKVETDDAARVNIAHGFGNANGIWWPYAFDDPSQAIHGCLFHAYGSGRYGHSLYEAGYVMPGVWPGDLGKSAWWQLDNSHDEIYSVLPPELAALVPGYKPTSPDKTTDFWVRDDTYATLIHGRNAERVTACGVTGWTKLTTWSWGDLA